MSLEVKKNIKFEIDNKKENQQLPLTVLANPELKEMFAHLSNQTTEGIP